QDIMEGEFSLQANLLKESNSWYGGNIFIKSSQGRILRLKTLSRIFKVVNITDFFEKTVENTGKRGFPFTQMDIDTHIHKNNLIVDRAIILGEGLNLFARGEIHLDDYDADLTLLIAPFKTFDTIVSKVPIIGQPVAGDYGSRMSIPVAVKGPIADPIITPMHPEAVGGAFLNLLKDTFMLPYNILKPLEKLEKDSRMKAAEEK
ncbi:MAG: AsmA-like C-terminal domain-containing protein, partial [Desulfobulbaceae bacterium]|nr:AsmA-like C-terminal domain-containing protein [Desulfobulbaceae bacterium]